MAKIVKLLGMEYVGVMHVDNNYGKAGAKAFKDEARKVIKI